jgi:hypothetical protein
VFAAGRDPAELPRLGSSFGRYRLDSIVGRGGMGIVFRATDTQLERSVALKFLAADLAQDPAFRERFVRESRLAAAIEHPGIVPIYEAGTSGDVLFIAMRLVPGPDLGSILRLEAPLSVDRTLGLARQLADALDAAHRKGLVHRDVKPANVLVERDQDGAPEPAWEAHPRDAPPERAVLVDFGLTRRIGESAAWSRAGPLGTADYMAPEQIDPGTADGRADQYALACLVFHCLTGAPPFERETETAVMYAHMHVEPPSVASRSPALSASGDAALMRALAKQPDDRFPDCRTFVAALGSAFAPAPTLLGGSGADGPVSSAARRSSAPAAPGRRIPGFRPFVLGAAGIAVIGLLALGQALPVLAPGEPAHPTSGHSAPTDAALAVDVAAPAPLGPAPGEQIVFASDVDGDFDLYALVGGDPEPRRLTDGSKDERSPAISPDGRTIAYVVGSESSRDIWLMASDGTDQRRLTSSTADDIHPAWAADGRSLAFVSTRSDPFYDIYEVGERGGVLDERTARQLTARPALEAFPSWLPQGRQLAIASNHYGGNRDVLLIDADDPGWLLRVTSDMNYDFAPVHAPDGSRIVFYRRPPDRGQADIYLMNAKGGALRQLTRTKDRDELNPDWAPDGRAIVYQAQLSSGRFELFVSEPDGSGATRLAKGWNALEPDWGIVPASPDATAGEGAASEPPPVASTEP